MIHYPGADTGDHRIEIGSNRKFSDSSGIREMKDCRKMSKAELLVKLEELKRLPATRSRAESKQAETALRDREEQLRAILETAVEGIITIDGHGIIESVNRAAENIFGYKARELVGKSVNLLMPSPHREHHDGYLNNYRHTGQAKIIGIGREVSGRRKDGSIFPMDLSVSEVRLAKGRLFTGFVRDITERKRLEKEILDISDREQRRIGHDLHDGLCQQLAGIELLSQVLEQQLADRSNPAAAKAGEIAKNVREAISHTRSLARGLSPVTLESEGLTAALMELAANTEKLFNVTCRFEHPAPVPVNDHATASNLFRIAQEAVSNAIKHGKATRIFISLEKNKQQSVLLRVSDNGTGFPTKIRQQKGMGLRIMQSRAGMIGGALVIERGARGGIAVTCAVPDRPAKSRTSNAR